MKDVCAENGPRLTLLGQVALFFTCAGLKRAPLFQVDETKAQADDEYAYRRVFDEIELVILITCLVDDDAMNLAGNDAAFDEDGSPGHDLKVVGRDHGRDDQTRQARQDEQKSEESERCQL